MYNYINNVIHHSYTSLPEMTWVNSVKVMTRNFSRTSNLFPALKLRQTLRNRLGCLCGDRSFKPEVSGTPTHSLPTINAQKGHQRDPNAMQAENSAHMFCSLVATRSMRPSQRITLCSGIRSSRMPQACMLPRQGSLHVYGRQMMSRSSNDLWFEATAGHKHPAHDPGAFAGV